MIEYIEIYYINLIPKKEESFEVSGDYNCTICLSTGSTLKVITKILDGFLKSFDGVRGSNDEVVNFQKDACISTMKFFTTNGILNFSIFLRHFSIQPINFLVKNFIVDMQASSWKLTTSSLLPLTPSKLFRKPSRIWLLPSTYSLCWDISYNCSRQKPQNFLLF